MYQGNVAYQLDTMPQALPRRRSLSVVEGGRSASRAPQPLAALATLAVVFALSFAVLGAARVALTTATVTSLRDIERAEMNVAEQRNTMTELKVERSALSSADRIQRIATENYGMVYATEVDTVVVDLASEADGEMSAEDAQEAPPAEGASNEA